MRQDSNYLENSFDLGQELEPFEKHLPPLKEMDPVKKALWDLGNEKTDKSKKEYPRTDLGNAERLVNLHGLDIRYCHKFHRWYCWDGIGWKEDNTGEINRRCKDVIRRMYAEAIAIEDKEDRKKAVTYALQCESDQKIKAMKSLAQSEPGISILPEHFNTDPYLFNCLNGTINLRTGELQPHRREDLITKLSPYKYEQGAQCSEWKKHLNKITGSNENTTYYLQKVFGYSMTGDTSERKLFTAYGDGANGKSATIDNVARAYGDYAMRTPTETLLMKRNDGIPNDVARLMGTRFAYASESEAGRSLAESKIKDMTGGEKNTARVMRG